MYLPRGKGDVRCRQCQKRRSGRHRSFPPSRTWHRCLWRPWQTAGILHCTYRLFLINWVDRGNRLQQIWFTLAHTENKIKWEDGCLVKYDHKATNYCGLAVGQFNVDISTRRPRDGCPRPSTLAVHMKLQGSRGLAQGISSHQPIYGHRTKSSPFKVTALNISDCTYKKTRRHINISIAKLQS